MKTLFLLKHCLTDQNYSTDKPLSTYGKKQAINLCKYLNNKDIGLIYSSNKRRTYESVKYLSDYLKAPIVIDNRLKDRTLYNKEMPSYFNYMEACFRDINYKSNAEESIKEVQIRLRSFLSDLYNSFYQNVLVSTHGVCVALILNYFTSTSAFNIWKQTKPGDLYSISFIHTNTVVDKVKYL